MKLRRSQRSIIHQRQEYNQKILDLLKAYLDAYPQLRFGQALVNMNIIEDVQNGFAKDPYNDEPIDIFNRLRI